MKQLYPTKINLLGNKKHAEKLIGFGTSQLAVLENQMSFQSLKQGARRVVLPNGIAIICRKCFNLKTVDIYYPPRPELAEEVIPVEYDYEYLSIVFGDDEEELSFSYVIDNGLFFPPGGDAVFCSDDGYGTYTEIKGNFMYGQFVKCWTDTITAESNNVTANITGCAEHVYTNSYNVNEIFSDEITSVDATKLSTDAYKSAYDTYPITDVACSGNPTIEGVWSKTYDDLIVTVYAYLQSPTDTSFVWSATVSYRNQVLTWGKSSLALGEFDPNTPTFMRDTCVGSLCLTKRKTHIGFDVWAIVNAEGVKEYYVGLIGEQEAKLHQWKYIPEDTYLTLDWSILVDKTEVATSIPEWVTEDTTEVYKSQLKRLIRLVGYGFNEEQKKHVIYWSYFPNFYYAKDEISLTQALDITTGQRLAGNATNMDIYSAIWNPILKQPLFVWNLASSYLDGTYGFAEQDTLTDPWNYYFLGTGLSVPCEDCTNDYVDITHTFNDVDISINTYIVVRPNEEFPISYAFRVESSIAVQAGDKYNRGDFILTIEDEVLSTYSNGARGDNLRGWLGTEGNESTSVVKTTSGLENVCASYSMADHSFLRGTFSYAGFVYEYQKSTYSSTCEINNTSLYKEGISVLHNSMALSWPNDSLWRSILLHGYCRQDDQSTEITEEVSNYVVYKDEVTKELFVLNHLGKKQVLDPEQNYDRAFFKQQYISIEEEDD